MKMAKKKKTPFLNIPDFFGICNTYKIFALKSNLSAFAFANTLGKIQNTTFTILPDFEYATNHFSAHYAVFYAELSAQESIHCLLLENKSIIDQQQQFVAKTEQKWRVQTGFLFEEWLYLFNNQGLHCFELEWEDIDYLLLFFAKKDIDHDTYLHFTKNLAPFQVRDVSYLLERQQTAAQEKIVEFLRDFYCKYEVNANQFSRKRKTNLLAPVQQIPRQNLQFIIPARLENETLADNWQLADDYLALLTEA
jgi:hypothetical protein